jgi:hypothetical protein
MFMLDSIPEKINDDLRSIRALSDASEALSQHTAAKFHALLYRASYGDRLSITKLDQIMALILDSDTSDDVRSGWSRFRIRCTTTALSRECVASELPSDPNVGSRDSSDTRGVRQVDLVPSASTSASAVANQAIVSPRLQSLSQMPQEEFHADSNRNTWSSR